MKKKLLLVMAGIGLAVGVNAQILYVPGGTSGIGTSTNGNVGIGTTSSPIGKFTINYPYNVSPSLTSSAFAPFVLQNANVEIAMGVDANGPFAAWLQARNNNTFWNLAINPLGGNVGIGTTNPTSKLHIKSGIGGAGYNTTYDNVIIEDNDHAYINLVGINSSAIWFSKDIYQRFGIYTNHDQDYLSLYAGNDIRMCIKPSGNIGIGTINPLVKFQINGAVFANAATSNSIGIGTTMEANSVYNLFGSNGYWGFRTNTSNAFSLDVYNNGSPINAMSVLQNGNVGIGTTNPQNKLDVNGTIHTKEVKVDLTGWSDFVFAPAYKLKPLAEVEQYIKTHNHLPEIPSAKEVEQNGVNLGDMQAKLLQKVEELTLYSIEQDKKLKEQEQLKAKVEEQSRKLQEQGQENAAMQLKLAKQEQEMKELRELVMRKLK